MEESSRQNTIGNNLRHAVNNKLACLNCGTPVVTKHSSCNIFIVTLSWVSKIDFDPAKNKKTQQSWAHKMETVAPNLEGWATKFYWALRSIR